MNILKYLYGPYDSRYMSPWNAIKNSVQQLSLSGL